MTKTGKLAPVRAVCVRRLAPGDTEIFRSVRLTALQDSPEAFGESLEAASQSDWSARTVQGSAFTDRGVFVALEDEHAIGMVFVKCDTPPAPAFLGAMWVQPQFRRHGIGRALVAHGLEFLRSVGQREVSLWVTSTHTDVLNFYRTLGFRQTGATASLRPGSPLTIVELSLDLCAKGS
jgi:ribosomal protein S18 acetylase RimI-like enzyme